MVKYYSFLIMSATFILWSSCSLNQFPDRISEDTKCKSNSISIEEVGVLAMAMARGEAITKGEEARQPEITPIVDIYKDTILYAVNFYPGWKLISSDKRTPIILAQNDKCFFDLAELSQEEAQWIECLAKELRNIKSSPDWEYLDNGISFKTIWDIISPPATRSEEGYYELYSSYSIPVSYRSIEHLTTTQWTQSPPFNIFCPYKTDGSGERVPAGCIAVAGAQLLLYLHQKIGRPIYAPSTGHCNGPISNPDQDFDNMSQTIWGHIATNVYYSALYIGYVGKEISMEYGDIKSRSSTSNLVDYMYTQGIDCRYVNYDEHLVSQSLLDSLPVYAEARSIDRTILGIPVDYTDHAFLIDGFRSYKDRIFNKYVKYNPTVSADSSGCVMYEPDLSDYYVVETESLPYVNEIQMNWGTAATSTNGITSSTWYTMTGTWNIGNDHYDHNRKILYDFMVSF